MFDLILLFLSILLYVFSYPPFNFSFLIFFTLIPLFHLISRVSEKEAFWYGFLYGFGFYGINFYWIPNLLRNFVNFYFGIFVNLLLISYLSLYNGLFLWGIKKRNSFLFPAFFWCFLEFIKSIGPLAFNWGTLGEPLVNVYPLLQWASIFGGLGLSFIVVLINTILYYFFKMPIRKKIFSILFVFLLFLVGEILGAVSYDSQIKLKVGVVQGNYDSFSKYYLRDIEDQLRVHKDLTLLLPDDLYLIVWAESVLFCTLNNYPSYLKELKDLAKEKGAYLIVGALKYEKGKIYNSAYLFSPFSDEYETYSKVQLVPFVEELPFSFLFPNYIKSLVGGYSRGEGFYPFKTPLANIGTLICFESLFSYTAREQIRNGADILVVITNDGWFQGTPAVWQHRNLSLIRAVENRAPLVQTANTGVTFFVDPYGKILWESREGEKSIYYQDVLINKNGFSLYRVWGDIPLFMAFIIYLIFRMKS
ncbi:MAG: apolipoprotein N-acyltransferase [Dictyoglomus sp. NZ13-RE01]|nr:MAG: apolipoprotein N-acyltransferase [Dictyoglomus sp. NZ13-RE01]